MLGKKTNYPDFYDPSFLRAIKRANSRKEIKYNSEEFKGEDIWTIYEFSHLLETSYPKNHIFTLSYDQASESIVESKSLKLYLNSFNNTKFSINKAKELLEKDLSNSLKSSTLFNFISNRKGFEFTSNSFELLENFLNKNKVFLHKQNLSEAIPLYSTQRVMTNLFRSRCPVTGQPDWASIYISINGKNGIESTSLLDYLLSFRNHQEFHEQCVERIIMKLREVTKADSISVFARFTRRGGIDINPYRYYGKLDKEMKKLIEKSRRLEFKDFRQ